MVIKTNPPLDITLKVPKNYTYKKITEADTSDWGITLTSPTGVTYFFCAGCQDFRSVELCGDYENPLCIAGRKFELNNITFVEYVYIEDSKKLALITTDYSAYTGDPLIRIETQDQRSITEDDIREMDEVLSCIVW